MKHLNNNFRIEICGGIASGKTSLAVLLEENNIGKIIYEDFHSNPFWKDFYENPGNYIFETELTFTLQHYHEIKKQQSNNTLLICDYSLLLDLAYANIGLNDQKLLLYHKILQELYKDIGHPDLYIYLECSENEELKRIKNRDRAIEQNIQFDFLSQLNTELINDINKFASPYILKINSEKYDFINNEKDKQEILKLVKKI